MIVETILFVETTKLGHYQIRNEKSSKIFIIRPPIQIPICLNFFIYSYLYSKFEFKLKIFEVIFDRIRKLSNLSNSFNFCQIIFNKNHLKV